MKKFFFITLVILSVFSLSAATALTLDTQAVYGTTFSGVETETTKAGIKYYHYETLVLNKNRSFELHITNTSNGIMAYNYAKGTYNLSENKITFKCSEGYLIAGMVSSDFSYIKEWKPAETSGTVTNDNKILINFLGYSGCEFSR